ncbi:hypothetical protein [Nocardia caishijiensis]|uniref:Uncharacterized protein n=1 Tax=Nocardia caishijiensis TaxID=184756 RepID=A0ABQ6YID5_9NOCA|nr:hypothetical protein [Nocardia caishijiensis]KAF0845269.1 hypothetical protein FNL39_10877 [Nocardia caishijiensis]
MTARDSGPAHPFVPFADGLVAAAALGELAATSPGVDGGSIAVFAVFVGIAAAVFGRARYLAPVAGFFYSAIGLLACIPVVAEFLRGTPCDTAPPALRYAIFALLTVLAGLGMFAAVVTTGIAPKFGLRWFGAVELLTAATSPFGIDALPDPVPLSTMILLAMPLGWLAARRSDAVLDGGTSALAAVAILVAAFAPQCADSADTDGIVMVLVFGATFAVASAIGASVRTRR